MLDNYLKETFIIFATKAQAVPFPWNTTKLTMHATEMGHPAVCNIYLLMKVEPFVLLEQQTNF